MQNVPKTHPGQWFLSAFIDGIEKGDPKYMNVAPIPVRMLLRLINVSYGEKIQMNAASAANCTQQFAVFLYDSYVNKYGLINVTERKLKELYLSTVLSRNKELKIEIFARFIGLSEIRYSADDLCFLLSVCLKLLKKVSSVAIYKKKDSFILEGIKVATIKDSVDVIAECLQEFWATKMQNEMVKSLGFKDIESLNTGIGLQQINVDYWCQTLVESYRKCKKEVQNYLMKIELVGKNDEYTEIYKDIIGYQKMLKKLNIAETKETQEIFERSGILVNDKEEIRKMICVEQIISFLIRSGISINKE